MYQVAGTEQVRAVEELPSPGLPSYPMLISGEHKAVLAYRIAVSDQDWLPTESGRDLGGEGDPYLVLRIGSPVNIVWTPACQEGLGKHPMAEFGLSVFSVSEVLNSPLIEPHPALTRRHFVFQFEDSTLDMVVEGMDAYILRGSKKRVALKLGEMFSEGAA